MAGLRMTVGCQSLPLATKTACVSIRDQAQTTIGSMSLQGAQRVRLLTHTITTEHYDEAEIINDNYSDLQAFHPFSVRAPRL